MNITAIIPARGGSKRLPRKNIIPLVGKPLISYTIEAALCSNYITETIVSSEDDEILTIASEYPVTKIRRPSDLAGDEIKNYQVVNHIINSLILQNRKPEIIVLLQPTSPLRNARHLDECLEAFISGNFESSISVCQLDRHPEQYFMLNNDQLIPFGKAENLDKRATELTPVFEQNGAIYVVRTKSFLRNFSFYHQPCIPYIMPKNVSIDIDDKENFLIAESYLFKNREGLNETIS